MKSFKSSTVSQLGLAKSPSMMVPTLISSSMTHSNIASALGGDSDFSNGRASLLKRSISVPGAGDADGSDSENLKNIASGNGSASVKNEFNGSKVSIPKLDDDETFSKFFTKTVIQEKIEVDDLDVVERSTERLLAGHKKAVQGPKRRQAARNPLKALAARKDLQSEYTEIKSGIAEKELKRIKFEQST